MSHSTSRYRNLQFAEFRIWYAGRYLPTAEFNYFRQYLEQVAHSTRLNYFVKKTAILLILELTKYLISVNEFCDFITQFHIFLIFQTVSRLYEHGVHKSFDLIKLKKNLLPCWKFSRFIYYHKITTLTNQHLKLPSNAINLPKCCPASHRVRPPLALSFSTRRLTGTREVTRAQQRLWSVWRGPLASGIVPYRPLYVLTLLEIWYVLQGLSYLCLSSLFYTKNSKFNWYCELKMVNLLLRLHLITVSVFMSNVLRVEKQKKKKKLVAADAIFIYRFWTRSAWTGCFQDVF
jgi:hypothetical protein